VSSAARGILPLFVQKPWNKYSTASNYRCGLFAIKIGNRSMHFSVLFTGKTLLLAEAIPLLKQFAFFIIYLQAANFSPFAAFHVRLEGP
jgi:hypothetical protein